MIYKPEMNVGEPFEEAVRWCVIIDRLSRH